MCLLSEIDRPEGTGIVSYNKDGLMNSINRRGELIYEVGRELGVFED